MSKKEEERSDEQYQDKQEEECVCWFVELLLCIRDMELLRVLADRMQVYRRSHL